MSESAREPWTFQQRYEFLDQAPKLGAKLEIYAQGVLVRVLHGGTWLEHLVTSPQDASRCLVQLREWAGG